MKDQTNSKASPIKSVRSVAAGLLVFTVLAFCFLSSSGCAWIGSAMEAMGGADATENTGDLPLPSAQNTDAANGSQQETYRENPVHALISAFTADWNSASLGLREAAANSEDAELAMYCMRFFACEAELALVDATVGLMSSEGLGWTGGLLDMYSGSGSMSSRGVFEYDMEDGTVIAGRVEGDALYAYVGRNIAAPNDDPEPVDTQSAEETEGVVPSESGAAVTPGSTEEQTLEPTEAPTAEPTPEPTPEPSSGDVLAIVLRRSPGGWMLTVSDGEGCRAMHVSDNSVSFRHISFAILPAGFPTERLGALSSLEAGELGTDVLHYGNGEAVLIHP